MWSPLLSKKIASLAFELYWRCLVFPMRDDQHLYSGRNMILSGDEHLHSGRNMTLSGKEHLHSGRNMILSGDEKLHWKPGLD